MKRRGGKFTLTIKRLFANLGLFLLLSACSSGLSALPTGTNEATLISNATPLQLTSSEVPATTSPTIAREQTVTATVAGTATTVPCEPELQFCQEAGHFLLNRPIAPPGLDLIDPSYPYGSTQGGKRDPHHGVEFYNGTGTPVLAAADGQVLIAGSDIQQLVGPRLDFYGNVIVLKHSFPGISQPIFTLYGHLSKILVQVGQVVQSGTKIGEVGATGEAIGSHLHFEVREGQDNYASNRNPVLWLKPLTGADGQAYGVIGGRVMDADGNDLYVTNINIQYYKGNSQIQTSAAQVDSYAPETQPVLGDDVWNENFSLGDIPTGNYRISLYYQGIFYQRPVVVHAGELTFAILQVGK